MSDIMWPRDPVRPVNTGVGSPNIDITNLWDFRDVLVETFNLQIAAGGPADVLLQFSQDGVTFDANSANYTSFFAPTGNGVVLMTALANAQQFGGRLVINHWNGLRDTWVKGRSGRTLSGNGARYGVTVYRPAVRLAALRITNSVGANWTTNSGVTVRGRGG